MYNSVTVTILAGIWHFLQRGYKYSLLKKILDCIKTIFKFLFKGSIFVNLFSSNRKMIEESCFYKIYCKFIDLISKFFKKINLSISNYTDESIIDKCVLQSFKDEIQIQNTACIFMLVFGFGVIILNVFRGKFWGKSYIISISIIILSLLGLSIKDNFKEILKNSFIFKFIDSLFSIDEGGEKWW